MTDRPKDFLLRSGKLVALCLQALCALAGGIVLLLVPAAIMASQAMLPASLGLNDLPIIQASAGSVVAILLLLALMMAALFLVFGKIRALIDSVGQGTAFTPQNARRLAVMGWLVLGVQILAIPVAALRYDLAHRIAPDDGGNAFYFSIYDLKLVLLALVLFILAQVFRQGSAMRDDLEGTV